MSKWLLFRLYRANSTRELAIKCLDTLLGKSLLEQFKMRRVKKIIRRPLLSEGCLGVCKDNKGFAIFLFDKPIVDGIYAYSSQIAVTLVHELGHTFGFEFDEEEVVSVVRGRIKTEENFAETFAHLWLSYPENRYALEKFLNKNSESIEINVESQWPA